MDAMLDDTSTGLSASPNEVSPPDENDLRPDPGLFALPVRQRVVGALTPIGFQFGTGAPTPDGYPNLLGMTRDRLILIQLAGYDDKLAWAEVLLTIPKRYEKIARFQGKILIVALSLMIPGWGDGPTIVGAAINRVRKKSPQVIHAPGEVEIRLTYRKQSSLLLRIQWPKLPTRS